MESLARGASQQCSSKHLLFKLASTVEKRRIFLQRPWLVFGFHLILKPWEPNLQPEEIYFSTTEFWVQVHNVPLDYYGKQNA